MATTRWDTAATIINDAMIEEGLAEIANPHTSADPIAKRMVRLLNSVGRELVGLYRWPQLRKACDITAALGDGRAWSVPADFAGYVPGTAWDQTKDQAIPGPITSEEWQRYEATGYTPNAPCFAFVQGVFAVAPTSVITDGDALQYEYHSKSWVSATGGTVPTDDRATVYTDLVYLPPSLVRVALRRAWRIANGIDTTVIESQFWRALDAAMSAETAAAPISIVPKRSDAFYASIKTQGWVI